ncbi:hypothetical protein V5N11_018550 [Cardamine amara subsp. amara]|uniref:Uncharacterized protein n=1 Tax=Cardamine amara subsp. amara TaxID=228776 RepID=A0ABD1A2N8_CARAN
MAGFREFQRQSFSQLRSGAFDQDDFDEFTMARQIFEAMEVTKFSDFWCKCMHQLQEDRFWRKYFIDKIESSNEDKLQFLEALTGCTRHGETCEKRLGSRQHYGSPSSSGVLLGSSSFDGNNLWGQTSHGQWGHGFQQSGLPPNAQQWGTPPNAQQWGTPPNAQQWGIPPNAQQWGTPPNAHQWGTPPNAQQ